MRSVLVIALLALLAVLASPAAASTQVPGGHRRFLLDEAAAQVQDVGAAVQATSMPDTFAAVASSVSSTASYAPDASDAAIGEALPPVTASAADLAAAAAVDAPASNSSSTARPRRRPIILTVPGNGLGAEAAVIPAQTTQITIYQFCNYQGQAGVASAGNYASLQSPWNDFVSSVRVPAGLVAVFYEHPNYGGRWLRVTGPADIPCFNNWQFSRITSSMQITASNSNPVNPPPPPPSNGVDAELLALVNAARRANGRRELSIDARLNAAALVHSQDQARRETMSHTGGDGSDFGTRMTRAGYRWRGGAENVAAGQASARSVFDAWMNSPGHRANILGYHVHMGAASAMGGNGRLYWTQVFGTPA